MRSLPRFTVLPAALVAAALVTAHGTVVATSVPDDSTPDEGSVVVLDEGKGDERFDLRPAMIAGTVAHSTETTITSGRMLLEGPESLDSPLDTITIVEQSAVVDSVAPDGSYVVLRTVDSYEFVVTDGIDSVADGFKSDEELEPLVGVTLEQHYDAEGRLVDVVPPTGVTLTSDQQASIATILEEGARRPPFPDLEVGVGAVWTATLPTGDSAGGDARYEVVSITDGTAIIEITFRGSPESLEAMRTDAFDEITGQLSGEGTLTADTANPMASTLSMDLSIDVTLTGDPGVLTMQVESSSSQEVTID